MIATILWNRDSNTAELIASDITGEGDSTFTAASTMNIEHADKCGMLLELRKTVLEMLEGKYKPDPKKEEEKK